MNSSPLISEVGSTIPPDEAVEVIRVEALHKYYQLGESRVHALRGIDVAIGRSEFLAIMGASGSGKSTFMNILGCLDRPSSGRYLLEGVDVSQHNKKALALIRNQKIGFVFQGFNLLARTTALENTELPTLYTKLKKRERQQRASAALALVGLSERAQIVKNSTWFKIRNREYSQMAGLFEREQHQEPVPGWHSCVLACAELEEAS